MRELILLFAVLPFLIMAAALIDILRNEFNPHQNKLIWVLVVLFMPFLGGILYFAIGQKNKI